MPIGSGSVSASAVNSELGRSSTAGISIDAAENGSYGAINQCSPSRPSASNPAAFSEWRSYNHNFACCNAPSISSNSSTSSTFTINISFSNCSAMHVEYSSNGGASWSTNTSGCSSVISIGGLASGTSYLVRVRITCASTGDYSGYSNTITMTTSAGCPPYGTYLSQYCAGCNLYYRYANGSCGTYDVNQGVSTACGGCCGAPAAGTFLAVDCDRCDQYNIYADGCYGTYSSINEYNSPACGCGGGGQACYQAYCGNAGRADGIDCFGGAVSLRCSFSGEYTGFCIDFNQPFNNLDYQNELCSGSEQLQ